MGFENLPAYGAALDGLKARIEALGTSAAAANLLAKLKALETQADATAKAVDAIPGFGEPGGFNYTEPSGSRNVQNIPAQTAGNINAVPPGFVRSPTGGLVPAAGGFSQVPTTALPGSPGIYIPEDRSAQAVERRMGRAAYQEEETAAMIARLEAFVAEIRRLFGENNFFAKIIEQEIANLRANVLSPQEAERVLRGLLGTFSAGLTNEIATATGEQRRLIGDVLRFLGGGGVPGGGDFQTLTPGPRGAPTGAGAGAGAAAGGSTAAGVSGGGLAGQIAGLGATITNQTERVLAGVRSQATETRAAAERNQRTVAEWQRSVEGSYLRPLRENMFSPRELRDAFQALLATRRV